MLEPRRDPTSLNKEQYYPPNARNHKLGFVGMRSTALNPSAESKTSLIFNFRAVEVRSRSSLFDAEVKQNLLVDLLLSSLTPRR